MTGWKVTMTSGFDPEAVGLAVGPRQDEKHIGVLRAVAKSETLQTKDDNSFVDIIGGIEDGPVVAVARGCADLCRFMIRDDLTRWDTVSMSYVAYSPSSSVHAADKSRALDSLEAGAAEFIKEFGRCVENGHCNWIRLTATRNVTDEDRIAAAAAPLN